MTQLKVEGSQPRYPNVKKDELLVPGTDVMILEIFSPKNLTTKLAGFLLKLLLVFAKICHYIGF
jgi:hypothetical protein